MRIMRIVATAAVLAAALNLAAAAAETGAARVRPAERSAAAAAASTWKRQPQIARARTEASFRRLDGAARTALGTCRRARGLRQRCNCLSRLTQLQTELTQEKLNIHETLLLAFKESIAESQEDKKYLLKKLKQLNALSEALSAHLAELTGSRRKLGRIGNPRGTAGGATEEPLSEARCREPRRLRHYAPR